MNGSVQYESSAFPRSKSLFENKNNLRNFAVVSSNSVIHCDFHDLMQPAKPTKGHD